MPFSTDDLIQKAIDQRGRNRLEEALVSAVAAVEQDSLQSEAWWQLALCRLALVDKKNAIVALEKTVDLDPEASNAWAKLGELYYEEGRNEEAEGAFEQALAHDSDQETALIYMAFYHQKRDDKSRDDEEISVLEKLAHSSIISSAQKNRLGALHYRNLRMHEAIRCWKDDVWNADHPSQRYNLGLAYKQDSISQEADAIDMWRLVRKDWPDYELAEKRISEVLPKLLNLATKVNSYGDTILTEDQWFDLYINPFQVLNIPEDATLEELDSKAIQKLKKTLLQEIELEDGKLSWLPGVLVDRSQAIGLCDELNDELKKDFHWQVFKSKPLLSFLTKGSHEHFLVAEKHFELECVLRVETDKDFLNWLGGYFAPQFDRILTKAIGQLNVIIIECLLDGRRWVPESVMDECFKNAQRAVEKLLIPLNEFVEQSENVKPSVSIVESILNRNKLIEIMNLLPVFFEELQNTAVHSIRSIAVRCFNAHDDIELSRNIMEIAKRFKFRSVDANRTIEEDIATIEELIRKEKKHEARLTSRGGRWEITKEGVRHGDRVIVAKDISSVRWGIESSYQQGVKSYDFLMSFTADDGRRLNFGWHSGEHDLENQRKNFEKLVSATFNYIFPSLIQKIEAKLSSGNSFYIGTCKLTKTGVSFESKGWFFTSQNFVPWKNVAISIENGVISVSDIINSRKNTSFSLRETDNAPLLKWFVDYKSGVS